jgi:hypothetical protein
MHLLALLEATMQAKRQNGKLVIEIDERAILAGIHCLPGNEMVEVIDREKFLNFLAAQICDFGDSGDFGGCSNMTRLLDDLVTHAAESAAGCEC